MVVDKIERGRTLSLKQIRYLDLLFPENETILEEADLAAAAGVKIATVRKWHRDPNFKYQVEIRISEHSESRMPRVWESILHRAEQGDVKAATLIFKLRGELVEKKELATKLPPATMNFVIKEKLDEK
jgi:hypothetical protein